MQRAAATRGTDATAAEARTRLDDFRREHVGVDRQGARGPLRSAKERVELARGALAEARSRHEGFLDATLSAEAAERAASSQARRATAIEAALASHRSAELSRRSDRAVELAARYPAEPAGAADRDARADAVAGALDALDRPASGGAADRGDRGRARGAARVASGAARRRHRGRSHRARRASCTGPRR